MTSAFTVLQPPAQLGGKPHQIVKCFRAAGEKARQHRQRIRIKDPLLDNLPRRVTVLDPQSTQKQEQRQLLVLFVARAMWMKNRGYTDFNARAEIANMRYADHVGIDWNLCPSALQVELSKRSQLIILKYRY